MRELLCLCGCLHCVKQLVLRCNASNFLVTSGDTGSSAIYGARNLKTIDVIVLYPHNRISKLQELMMTTAGADNIHLYAGEIYSSAILLS